MRNTAAHSRRAIAPASIGQVVEAGREYRPGKLPDLPESAKAFGSWYCLQCKKDRKAGDKHDGHDGYDGADCPTYRCPCGGTIFAVPF